MRKIISIILMLFLFTGAAFAEATIANPWVDMTADQLMEASGLSFGVPEGAEDVVYRYLEEDNLAEMQFTWDGEEFCARMQPAGEWTDISGMYFEWENEEAVTIHHCEGIIGQAQTGSEDWIERCMWFDAAPGLMCSLAVYSKDLDGLDLTVLAEQVYIPPQGDVDGPESTDAALIGDWETKDGMAVMTIEKNPGGEDWDVEIASPLTHGAYIFKTTIRYDDAQYCFSYNEGNFWDVPITDSDVEPELGEAKVAGTNGTFTFTGDPGNLILSWEDDSHPDEVLDFHKLSDAEEADGNVL